MNNKGFTLIELLATIAILGLVLGIAGISVANTINNSKTRSEKLFVEELSKSIDDYIDLKGSTWIKFGEEVTFDKCKDKECKNTYQVIGYQVKKSDGSSIYLKDLVDEHLVDEAKIVNPRNKLKCLDGKNPEIKVFKDKDYVYYYYVDLSGNNTSCKIEENNIINTLPKTLSEKVNLS